MKGGVNVNLPTLMTSRLIIRPISVLDAYDMYEYALEVMVSGSAAGVKMIQKKKDEVLLYEAS